MPSVTVNATLQGRVFYTLSAGLINWTSQVRDASTGSTATTYTSGFSQGGAIRVYLIAGRSGYVGHCSRVFLFFDNLDTLTGGGTITAATLKVYNASSSNAINTIPVEATAWGSNGTSTTLSTSDYSNLNQSIPYASEKLTWSSGYNDYSLNNVCIAEMNANGYLNVAVIEGQYDYGNTSPALNQSSETASVRFLDSTNKIKLELTYTAAGYGNDVINVPSSSVKSIINIASGDIDTVINV
jgi:hypothetical protein